ncbi:hypothetical protein P3T27_005871 [Kitasatospora sp. MAA19]|uniref:hypothetical protein n=1 Tax=unclassified Kitasatospora TaxID=2633591 RepID=UPI0024735CF4|nr:hypothetical protein [Kitasatospora sp. MAA19]MDH6709125.1 hypothetical protein [Kitasatospora sp. MAA19]
MPNRGRDMAALERKIRSSGRAWTMGDGAVIVDGQWAVRTVSRAEREQDKAVEARLTDGRRVELSLEELARMVGATNPGAHHDREPN